MTENELSYLIRGSVFEVFNILGPVLLESVYQRALTYELLKKDLETETEVPIPLNYKGQPMDLGFRIDILVKPCSSD